MIDLIQSQLLEPLRVGLIIGLVITMFRTAAVTGQLVPLALGLVFVAVILPATNPDPSVTLIDAVIAGVVANLILLAVVFGVVVLVRRFRGQR